MSTQITFRNVENADRLDEFEVVSGKWRLDVDSERDYFAVVESVENWMHAPYELKVEIFHADGRQITGDMPSEGTFSARRK